MRRDLEVRDAGTWEPSGGLVGTWIIRPAPRIASNDDPMDLEIEGEKGGINILYLVSGTARVARCDGAILDLRCGDTLSHSPGVVCEPFDASPDMRMIKFFISARAQMLGQQTPEAIRQLEALGPRIITCRELRREGDTRPVNFLQDL